MKKPLQSFLQSLNLNDVLDGDASTAVPWSQLHKPASAPTPTPTPTLDEKETRETIRYEDATDTPAAPDDFYDTAATTVADSVTTTKYTPPPPPPTTTTTKAPITTTTKAPIQETKVAEVAEEAKVAEVAEVAEVEEHAAHATPDADKAHFFVEELNEVIGDFIARYEAMEKKQILAAKHRVIETYEQLLHALTADYQHALHFGTMQQHEERLLERSRKLLEYDRVIALIRQL